MEISKAVVSFRDNGCVLMINLFVSLYRTGVGVGLRVASELIRDDR